MTINDITGDRIRSKTPSKQYLKNYDIIFNKNVFKRSHKLGKLTSEDIERATIDINSFK